jgi:hypothetical protein
VCVCARARERVRAFVSECVCVWGGVRGKRVFITNVKGTFFGMSESEEASKRR